MLLLSGASVNARTEFLHTAPLLCVAAHAGFIDMVALLLEFSATVDMTGDDGMSAICHAAQEGHIEVIRLLIARQAKVSMGTWWGYPCVGWGVAPLSLLG